MSRHTVLRAGLVGLFGLTMGVAPVGAPVAVAATTITVTSAADDASPGTLRTAIVAANSTDDDVEIVLTPGLATITFATSLPAYAGGTGSSHSLTITGNGASIDATQVPTAFRSTSTGRLTLQGLKISGVSFGIDASASAALIDSVLAVEVDDPTTATGIRAHDVDVVNSHIGANGHSAIGIEATGDVTLDRAAIGLGFKDLGDATSEGFSVRTEGNLSVSNSRPLASLLAGGDISLYRSSAVTGAAPVVEAGGHVDLVESTVGGYSGGDGIVARTVSLTNSTVGYRGGRGIVATTVTLTYSTLAYNGVEAEELRTFGSFIGNTSPACVVEKTISYGYNYATDLTCNLSGVGDHHGGHVVQLGPLQLTAGPTPTFIPISALRDKIPAESCQAGPAAGIPTDQRGICRPQGGACDIGAVEVEVFQVGPPLLPAPLPSFTG